MSAQLKKISILSNAVELQELKGLMAKIKSGGATKEELTTLNSKVTDILTVLKVDDTALDTLKEIVDFIKNNKQFLDALSITNILGLKDALDAKADKTALTKVETEVKASIVALETKLAKSISDNKTAIDASVAEVKKQARANAEAIKTVTASVAAEKTATSKLIEAAKLEATNGIKAAKEESTKAVGAVTTALNTAKDESTKAITAVKEEASKGLESAKTTLNTSLEEVKKTVVAAKTAATEEVKVAKEANAKEIAANKVAAESNFVKMTFGTEDAKKTVPTFVDGTHKAGTIVLDAQGNLCIVENTAV